MGSRHRALLNITGGGEKLHEVEKNRYQKNLNDFLASHGINDEKRGAVQAHFDMGYDNGYSGEAPFYNEDWDSPMGYEAEGA